jgi:trehalose 6-phosphate phosphatase
MTPGRHHTGEPDRRRVRDEVREEDDDLAPPADAVVQRLADTTVLLVASDFDGVIAPIVDDPERSAPIPGSIDALAHLATRPDTIVAIVSGRERRQLETLVPGPDRFILVGSHGAEIGGVEPDETSRGLLVELTARLDELAADVDGFFVEPKALSVAAHFRRIADQADRERVADAVDRLRHDWPVKVVAGKEVVEFTVATATKGDAIRALGRRHGATATVYLGDDVTDEDAFAVLGGGDVGIKVGPGPTAATHRLDAPPSVTEFLRHLARVRPNGTG